MNSSTQKEIEKKLAELDVNTYKVDGCHIVIECGSNETMGLIESNFPFHHSFGSKVTLKVEPKVTFVSQKSDAWFLGIFSSEKLFRQHAERQANEVVFNDGHSGFDAPTVNGLGVSFRPHIAYDNNGYVVCLGGGGDVIFKSMFKWGDIVC